MAILDALGAYLQTAGVGTLGTSLFLSQLPETPDAAVALYELAPMTPGYTFGAAVTAVERPRIRAVCRAARNDYPTARAKAEQVRAALGAIRSQTLSGIVIECVLDDSGVYPLGLDASERPAIAVTFSAWVRP